MQKPPPGEGGINLVLERAKAEWEAAFDSISEGIALVDLDGTVKRVNRALATLLGRDVRNMIGISCCDLFAHHRQEPDACPVKNYPKGEHGTFEVFFPDYRYHEDSVHPIMRAGTVQGLVITVRDITREQMANQEKRHFFLQVEEASRKRQLAEEALEEVRAELHRAEKSASVGHLAGTVFAEVNRAMHMVRDGLGILRQELAAGRRPDATVTQELHSTSARCISILDKLAELRVVDAEAIVEVDLQALLQELLDEARADARDAQVKLALDTVDLPPVEGNRDQLRAVFASIALNALEASRAKHGSVTLTLRREGRYARVEVVDTGGGIAADHLPQVFNPFFTATPREDRIGLGLTICQAIVQGHRGHIAVDSTPGQGTRVKVLLPLTTDPA